MMQRILFVHRAANLGGSQNSTYTRMKALDRLGIESESLFYKSGAGIDTFDDFYSYVTNSASKQVSIIRDGEYDLVSIINFVPFLKVLRQAGYRQKTLLEIRGRAYLSLGQCPNLTRDDIDAIMVPSLYVRSLVEKVLGDTAIPIHVVSNGVDTHLFSPSQRPIPSIRKLTHPNTRIVLWVGRLSSVKNWAEMLQIASLIADDRSYVEFWVIGDSRVSPDTDAFLNSQKSLGLPNIRLFGCVPYHDMPKFYALVRESRGCVLSTSLSEGLQNSLLEGMACGVPVVSSAIGGNLELIQHGMNGFLYESGDPAEGAQRIIDLLEDEMLWKQLADNGRQEIKTKYTMAKHAEAFIRVALRLENA